MCNRPIYLLPTLKVPEINESISIDIFGALEPACAGVTYLQMVVLEIWEGKNQIY